LAGGQGEASMFLATWSNGKNRAQRRGFCFGRFKCSMGPDNPYISAAHNKFEKGGEWEFTRVGEEGEWVLGSHKRIIVSPGH